MISTSHLHPMLVHFPIALVAFGFIAEILGLYFKRELCFPKIGFYLLIFGTLTALLALLSGAIFTSEMTGEAGKIQETHGMFASITLLILIAASALRIFIHFKKKENEAAGLKRIALILYGIAAITVSITGFYGGTLVYSYMMPI